MDERTLFDRFHAALDIEPNQAGYERLRMALVKSTSTRHTRLGFQVRLPKVGLRLAAVMTLVVLAIAAAAAFIASHRVAESIPSDSNRSILAYKVALTASNNKVVTEQAKWTCLSGDQFAACEADATSQLAAGEQYLRELSGMKVPTRFAVAHAQILVHVSTQNARIQLLIDASRAHNAAQADQALADLNSQTGSVWVQTMIPSIEASQQGTVATYLASVQSEKQLLESCGECNNLASQAQYVCTGAQVTVCRELVNAAELQVKTFQNAVVKLTAPDSLTAKDHRLQVDLAQADTALVSMTVALAAGNQGAFDAARSSFRQGLAAVKQDAAVIMS